MFLALLLTAAPVPPTPATADWKTAIKDRVFAFDADKTGAGNSVDAAKKAGLTAEFVADLDGRDGTFTFQKKASPKVTISGHTGTVAVVRGDSLYVANFSPYSSGCSVALYDLRKVTPEARQLAEICQMCCDRVKTTVALLTDIKRSDAILKCCEEIDRLESDADRVLRSALSKLFREETDLKQVMKLRVIYDLLETITDRCEDVANVVEGIVLENS